MGVGHTSLREGGTQADRWLRKSREGFVQLTNIGR